MVDGRADKSDDILACAHSERSLNVRSQTGEHCHNRVMFKQLMQATRLMLLIDSCLGVRILR